jgi:hypothetical protein
MGANQALEVGEGGREEGEGVHRGECVLWIILCNR